MNVGRVYPERRERVLVIDMSAVATLLQDVEGYLEWRSETCESAAELCQVRGLLNRVRETLMGVRG